MCRIALMGPCGVGKTLITFKFMFDGSPFLYGPPSELHRKNVQLDGAAQVLDIFDMEGDPDGYEYGPPRLYWMSEFDCFIFVFSLIDRSSYDCLPSFYEDLVESCEGKKLKPVIVVGNKCDLTQDREVTRMEGVELAKSFNGSPYLETSATSGKNIELAFHELIRIQVMRNRIPERKERFNLDCFKAWRIAKSIRRMKANKNFNNNCLLVRIGSDCMGLVISYLPDDVNLVNLCTCCQSMIKTGYMNMFPLKQTYTQRHIQLCPTLKPLQKLIRHWAVTNNSDNLVLDDFLLISVKFYNSFNRPINQLRLPSSLRQLTFGHQFDQSVNQLCLPSSLQQLTFGARFNQPVDQLRLPPSLQQLTFGEFFNHPVEQLLLLDSLQSLILGEHFNQPVNHQFRLPPSLQQLTLGSIFNQQVDQFHFPSSLQELTFVVVQDSNQKQRVESRLSSLRVSFGSSFEYADQFQLPPSLLRLNWDVYQAVDRLQLPSSLQQLTFGEHFNQLVDRLQLPSSLQHLSFGYSFNQPVDLLVLPSSLRYLGFGKLFNHPLESLLLPSSLQQLRVGENYSHPPVSLLGIEFLRGAKGT